ncbi:MAG TPA: amidase [Terriglobia bacterium]|nr:amidase [Terriglobia bacterium]
MTTALHEMSLADVAALIRSRQVSPVEVTQAALDRIESRNPALNAFWTITAELAREQARAAETEIVKGNYRGPLHGVPVALKDLVYTQGIRTTAGSKILAEFVPEYDATVVEKLRAAGAVLVGKTALHEFAYGITNENPHFGPTRNPWKTDRVPGGSSGGSGVAVATGMCYGAVGTDTGGSIRVPASFCGIAGLKPTYGRVSLHGIYPLAWTLDHAGPMARTVVDVGLLYQHLAGFDPRDEFSEDHPVGEIGLRKSLQGVRLGLPTNYFFDSLQPEVELLVRQAAGVLEELGAKVAPVTVPGIQEVTEANLVLLAAEAYAGHREHLEQRPGDLGKDVRARIEKGREISGFDYVQAHLTRRRVRRQWQELFASVQAILTPTTPLTAFPLAEALGQAEERTIQLRAASTQFLRGFNATGHPALSVCCGFDSEGLPAGMQIVGALWDEATVLRVGYAYEQATDWHTRHP